MTERGCQKAATHGPIVSVGQLLKRLQKLEIVIKTCIVMVKSVRFVDSECVCHPMALHCSVMICGEIGESVSGGARFGERLER